ncbi:hypothetical protein FACS1894125_1520 [Actinomycetota bacterium]|nr:hypothetical protein FACS1894125_1520 [Actinomycetota bacterium]
MKNYYAIVPLLIVFLFGISWYYVVSNHEEVQAKYNLLKVEFEKSMQERNTFVVHETYRELNELKPDFDLSLVYANYIKDNEDPGGYISVLNTIRDTYPFDSKAYEKIVELYIGDEDYANAYSVINDARKNAVDMTKLSQYAKDMKYKYNTYLINGVGIHQFSDEGITFVSTTVGDNYFFNYVNTTGESISQSYSAITPFGNGFGGVVNSGKPQIINNEGKKIYEIGLPYIAFGPMGSNGAFATQLEDHSWIYLNKDFSKLFDKNVSRSFDYGSTFVNTSDGSQAAVKYDGSWKIINGQGERSVKESYDTIYTDGLDRAIVADRYFAIPLGGDKFKMYKTGGQAVCDKEFTLVNQFTSATSPTVVQIDGKNQFIDVDCNIVLNANAFEDAHPFSNGFAAVKRDGLWGYIDRSGNVVVDFAFAEAGGFSRSSTAFVVEKDRADTGVLSVLNFYSTEFYR